MMNTVLTIETYTTILLNCIIAWNRADPEAVASYYTDVLDYRDPSVPAGITTKEDFIKYLKIMFHYWPRQEWVPGMVEINNLMKSDLQVKQSSIIRYMMPSEQVSERSFL